MLETDGPFVAGCMILFWLMDGLVAPTGQGQAASISWHRQKPWISLQFDSGLAFGLDWIFVSALVWKYGVATLV